MAAVSRCLCFVLPVLQCMINGGQVVSVHNPLTGVLGIFGGFYLCYVLSFSIGGCSVLKNNRYIGY